MALEEIAQEILKKIEEHSPNRKELQKMFSKEIKSKIFKAGSTFHNQLKYLEIKEEIFLCQDGKYRTNRNY